MRKSGRIASFVSQLGVRPDSDLDPRYEAFFQCFNEQRYYEAHDVLEDLWLESKGGDHFFFKALIQVAGAFVHLGKQFQRPQHPKDGARLRPAERLLRTAMRNLDAFRPLHLRLDVEALHRFCGAIADEIVADDFRCNPWNPGRAPRIDLIPR